VIVRAHGSAAARALQVNGVKNPRRIGISARL